MLLAREGGHIVLTDCDEAALAETEAQISEHGSCVAAMVQDVTEPGRWPDVIAFAEQKFGGLDVLVNNAVAAL